VAGPLLTLRVTMALDSIHQGRLEHLRWEGLQGQLEVHALLKARKLNCPQVQGTLLGH
jgi:hypothetical protein